MSEAVGGLDLTTEPKLDHGDGDHDRFSHYVSREDAMKAYIEGVQVTALCGKKWGSIKGSREVPHLSNM